MIASFLFAACEQSHPPANDPIIPEPGETVSQMIGNEGGTIALEDFELTIPSGALATPTMITVTVNEAPPPSTFAQYSPVFHFEPAGLTFEEPIAVRIPYERGDANANVFWTSASNGAYVALPTRIEGGFAYVESVHFSEAFVGAACTGDNCCGPANGDLDVLFLVDNSNSMSEEQASLAVEIPRLARVLATGDLDDDGVQDFPALHSLHVGTVTSDMGTGGHDIPTCTRSDHGDDGILRTVGRVDLPGCAESYPPYASLDSDDPAETIEAFVSQIECTANTGTGGCGFEQQLDAVLKGLTPSTSPIRFYGDTTGNGDGANAGFQRDESILATILLTDEEDCSAANPELFSMSSPEFGGVDLNLRCFSNPGELHPIHRFSDGLRALRANPDDVIFALVAGVPVDLVSDPDAIDYDAILADPRMEEAIDPSATNRLIPSCNVEGRGVAFPPRRMVQVARELGSNAVVQSICQSDYRPVVDAILTRVAARVRGECGTE